MKGGKDVEKMLSSPLFPRLHVNDTEKGGPRAPPRNKMALYEQLSIPSQRFNSGSTVTASKTLRQPPDIAASFSQEGGRQHTVFPPFYLPVPAQAAEKPQSQSSEGVSLSTIAVDFQRKSPKSANNSTLIPTKNLSPIAECGSFRPNEPFKSKGSIVNKIGNEDDFRVPTFVHSKISQHNTDGERNFPMSSSRPGRSIASPGNTEAATATCSSSMQLQHARDKHLKRTNTTDLRSRQQARNPSEENPLSGGEPLKHSLTMQIQENKSVPLVNLKGLYDSNKHLHQEYGARFVSDNTLQSDDILPEVEGCVENGNLIRGRNESYSRNSIGSLQVCDVDRNDDVSETSMLDTVSGLDISPDDVVGVIGQKHFWKARRAIANQQRLFAVQVFELHRLIKVQKLIAGSPHLLLEDTLKVYSAKKLSTKYVVNSPPQILRPKDDTQKPNREYATENAVVNLPLPSVSDHANTGRVDTLRSSYGPFSGNLPPAPVAADNKTGQGPSPGPGPGWGFQPPPGNQWLVPVMTPSEGLVYKPFAGPCPPTAGFMAPVYGGDFMNPSYMMPSHPHGPYFPPYGTQVMNPQVTSFSGSQNQLQGHVSQLSTGEVNMQKSRNSCNNSKQKSDTISGKVQTSKESELQGSTASSPFEKAQRGARALPLFPVNRPPESPSKDLQQQQARAIKVVPHNRRSATESAARIFRSIQEERQQHDSV